MNEIDKLPILTLYPHNRCNCRCVMCDIWKLDSKQELSAADIARHIGDIRSLGVEWVVLSGGEPLMHGDLFALCRLLKTCNVRITLLSTGLLLSRHAAAIAVNIDDVIVSLDGPPEVHDRIRRIHGAFDQLSEGVRALRRERADFPVTARCTVQRWNATEMRRTVTTARDLDVRSISFLAADVDSTAFNRPLGLDVVRREGLTPDPAALHNEVETLIAEHAEEIASGFIAESPEKLRRIVRHFRDESHAPKCNAPWVSAVVESNGDVRPCFFQPSSATSIISR